MFASNANKISHKIHFFWAGGTFPEQAVLNLISFIKNLPDTSWKVYLWLTDEKDFKKSTFFNVLEQDQSPSSLIVKNVHELLDSNTIDEIARKFTVPYLSCNVKQARDIIKRELIGLGNPAAAKDGLVPLILYAEGGYYFDLDSKAYTKITAPKNAKHGILLINGGTAIACLAAEKSHKFCAYILMCLVSRYTELPQEAKNRYNMSVPSHPSPKFFELQPLRDRKNDKRTPLTVLTSGSSILQAYQYYKIYDVPRPLWNDFIIFTHFSIRSVTEAKLTMGIQLHLKADGEWRNQKDFRPFDDTICNLKYVNHA